MMGFDPFDFMYQPPPQVATPEEIAKAQAETPALPAEAQAPGTASGVILDPAVVNGKVGGAPISVGETNETTKKPNPFGTSFDIDGLTEYLRGNREKDMVRGSDFAKKYFGEGNADMSAVLEQRKKRAMGLNAQEVQSYRERGEQGINQQMATSMRALRGLQAGSGVRGGAAAAQAIPIVNNANNARGALERDIGIADMERRGTELNNYEKSLTGERAGELGTIFGYAGLGAGDRSSALQYGLGKDMVDTYGKAAGVDLDTGASKPWNVGDAVDSWKKSNYDPREAPWTQWLHQNVFDPKDHGLDTSQFWLPNQFAK